MPSSPRIVIVKNRAISTIALFVLFLLGFDKTTFGLSVNLCKGVAAMIHFSGLAIFSWTLLEGVQLLRTLRSHRLMDAASTKYSDLIRYLVGYGSPLVFTFIALFISFINNNDGNEYLSSNDYCWLRENSFIFFFVVPVALVIVFNCFVFVKAFVATNETRRRRQTTSAVDKVYGQIKSCALISFMLGIPWAFGFLIQAYPGFSYVFVILNGSSGVILFVHTILMNDIVMLELRIRLGLVDQVELAINRSGDRITATKSFSVIDKKKPKVHVRRQNRDNRQISTSSDEMPPLPRPPRKQKKQKPGAKVCRSVFTVGDDQSPASTPENTSLSSSNSVNPSSFEQSSSESLYKRRDQKLERRLKTSRPPSMVPGGQGLPRLDELSREIVHDRLTELRRDNNYLKRHNSNKW